MKRFAKPLPQLFKDRFYPLLWTFDLIGERIFSDQWTGTEHRSGPTPSPDEIRAQRAPLEKRVARFEKQWSDLRDRQSRITDEAELGQIKSEIDKLTGKKADTNRQLIDLPEVGEASQRRYKSFQRRVEAEGRLLSALRGGELTAYVMDQLVIDSGYWRGRRGFKYYLSESLVILPRSDFGQRRGMAAVAIQQFDGWLEHSIGPGGAPPPEELAKAYLRELFEQQPTLKRDEYLELVKRKFPEFSMRKIRTRIWDEVAGVDQTKPGRRPTIRN